VELVSTVLVQLDTHAPAVEWGAVGGTTAGELLQIEYAADEMIATADVVLRDGRTLAMTVGPTTLEALLPPDTPEGAATVRVRDDVGNELVDAALLTLVGLPYVPPVPPPIQAPRPGWPLARPPRRRREHVVQTRSRARVRSATQVSVTRRSRQRQAIGLRSGGHARVTIATAVAVISRTRLDQRHAVTSVARLRSRATVRRRDGGDDEALLLGLI
jgi:hypothetical protein